MVPCWDSLAIQWLGLRALTAEGPGSTPGWGIKIPQAAWCSQKKKKKWYHVVGNLLGVALSLTIMLLLSRDTQHYPVPLFSALSQEVESWGPQPPESLANGVSVLWPTTGGRWYKVDFTLPRAAMVSVVAIVASCNVLVSEEHPHLWISPPPIPSNNFLGPDFLY